MIEIPINLVYEDAVSGAVVRRLLQQSRKTYLTGFARTSGGFGWIKSHITGLNAAAKGMPYFVLTDLDATPCVPTLIQEWLPHGRHHNLVFCVAVREVEAWVLGCRREFAHFLGIPVDLIPHDVDEIPDPKATVIDLARRSRRRAIREDIAPEAGSTASVGPDYNGRLCRFVNDMWDPVAAGSASPSLSRTIRALDAFEPIIERESLSSGRHNKRK